MSVSLICLYVIFLVAGLVTSMEILCGVVSALLQYFMLVFLGWTAAEAVSLFYKVICVFGSMKHYVLKAALTVWRKLLCMQHIVYLYILIIKMFSTTFFQ